MRRIEKQVNPPTKFVTMSQIKGGGNVLTMLQYYTFVDHSSPTEVLLIG